MTTGSYKSSFVRTLHERTDAPVFTVEDAVAQMKNTTNDQRGKLERAMDEFYCKNLPQDIMGVDGEGDLELDEENIKRLRQQTNMKASKTKTANYLHGEVVNPQRSSVAGNKIRAEEGQKKKPKSQMALTLQDSREIGNLEKKLRVDAQVNEKRRSTMIDRKGTKLHGGSSPKRNS